MWTAVALIHNEPPSDHVLKRDKRFQVGVRLPMSLSSCQVGRPIATGPEPQCGHPLRPDCARPDELVQDFHYKAL